MLKVKIWVKKQENSLKCMNYLEEQIQTILKKKIGLI